MKRWALLFAALAAGYAQNIPHAGYVLPAGGQRGVTVEVELGGQFLPNIQAAYVSGGGVQVAIGDYERPMNANQATELRDRMQELQKQQPPSEKAREEMIGIRAKLLLFNHRRLISPVLAETRKLRITIAPGAASGRRELRVLSPQGLSNPLVFVVGDLPEVVEKETIEVVRPAANQQPNQATIRQPRTDMAIELPVVVNGRIKPRIGTAQQQGRQGQPFTPGEADRYHFHARAGQSLIMTVAARDLMPYLADAVPGWFQAVLALYDSAGKEVAYNDDFRFHPDPVIHYVVPSDGDYTVEIRDAIYRGREDFVYRLTVGELPLVTDVFPLGGRIGAKTAVELAGWNIASKRFTMDLHGKQPGVYEAAGRPFQADNLPEMLEKEPNDTLARAQAVKLPVVVNGRIDQAGDRDVFKFQSKSGQMIVAEVYARRLDSPLDSVLKLTDAKGRQLAFNDDFDDPSAGLETHHADSRILYKIPAAGTYYLTIADTEHRGGAEFAYRLRISEPRPDFELRVTPAAINTAGGVTIPLTIHAIRRDGFDGEIRLAVKNAPRGVTLSGATIPAGASEVRFTLTTPAQPQAQSEPVALDVEGTATIRGAEVMHLATPAEEMMQAFFYKHLVPSGSVRLVVRRGNTFPVAPRVTTSQPLRIPLGGTLRVAVQAVLPPSNGIEKLVYELSDPPAGIELREVIATANGAELVLACDAAKAKAATATNLIIAISGDRKPAAGAPQQANRQRVALGTLPAVPLEIVPADTVASR